MKQISFDFVFIYIDMTFSIIIYNSIWNLLAEENEIKCGKKMIRLFLSELEYPDL